MEALLIEQLRRNGVSIQQLKTILDELESKHGGGENIINANKNGLRLIVCKGCHKTQYEDKFMLNNINRRYRSCINCVTRATKYREKQINNVIANENLIDNDMVKEKQKGDDKNDMLQGILKAKSRTKLIPTDQSIYYVRDKIPEIKKIMFEKISRCKNNIYNINGEHDNNRKSDTHMQYQPCIENGASDEDLPKLRFYNIF